MLLLQYLGVVVGVSLIRLLHVARRRMSGDSRYFSFSDFLIDERAVESRGFLGMALPPVIGGIILAVVPAMHPETAVAAGFLAAFLGVWPVYQFPYQLLDPFLLHRWGKLKYLYALFIGFSATASYVGFLATRAAGPILRGLTGTNAWEHFTDDIEANALYDIAKAGVVALFGLGGWFVSRERKRIGADVEREKHGNGPPLRG